MKYKVLFSLFSAALLLSFVQESVTEFVPDLPATPLSYNNPLPQHFVVNAFPPQGPPQNAMVANDNTPPNNPITDAGATLGRVLFYDKALSQNGTVACASCHLQANGFADPRPLSIGFAGGTTRRHSMGLGNARFYDRGRFFWDERAATLEDQVLQPFQDPVEMGLTLPELVNIVQSKAYYPDLFTDAFGDATIDTDRISRALAQFVRSMASHDSKYDEGRVLVNDPIMPFPNYTALENQGKALFINPGPGRFPCLGCHGSEGFITPPPGPTNNGLDAVSTDDLGVFEAIPQPQFLGAFKSPSLRNIAVTAPYMHDGRFATLEQVINHYSNGIQNHQNLAPPLRGPNGQPLQYNFNPQERDALLAFMNTLTDNVLTTDERWSDPFVEEPSEVTLDVSLKVMLEGPFDGSTLMNDVLRTGMDVPLIEPYSDLGYTYVDAPNGEIIQNPMAVLGVAGNGAIVDWIFVELRDSNNSGTVVAARSGLLQRDGDVVDVDGISLLDFPNTSAGAYYIAVHHRNHLAIMTQNPITLSNGGSNSFDFSAMGVGILGGMSARKNINGTLALWAGDANGDTMIDALDRGAAWNQRNMTGYLTVDTNLDGICDALDRGLAWNNRNKSSLVP